MFQEKCSRSKFCWRSFDMFMIFSVLLLGKCVWTFWLPFSVISSWRFAKVARVKWQKETLKICGDMMNQRRPPFARLWVCQRFQPICHQRHWFGSGSCARSLHCRWVPSIVRPHPRWENYRHSRNSGLSRRLGPKALELAVAMGLSIHVQTNAAIGGLRTLLHRFFSQWFLQRRTVAIVTPRIDHTFCGNSTEPPAGSRQILEAKGTGQTKGEAAPAVEFPLNIQGTSILFARSHLTRREGYHEAVPGWGWIHLIRISILRANKSSFT